MGALACALSAAAAAAAAPRELTAMTFNIASAVETGNELGPIAETIERYSPDVVGLQEVDRSWSRSDSVDQPRELGLLLGMRASFDPNVDCSAVDYDFDGVCEYGTAILTRLRTTAAATRQFRLFRPPWDEARGLAQVGVSVRGRRITVFNTHLSGHRVPRREQVREILRRVTAVRGPFVLMGDFNARPRDPEVRWLRARLVDAAEVARVRRPTVGSTRVDYVFASRGARVVWARVPSSSARRVSDHRPLAVRLRFP